MHTHRRHTKRLVTEERLKCSSRLYFVFGGKQTNTTRRQREDEGRKEGKKREKAR
jgi:hypothetical protein